MTHPAAPSHEQDFTASQRPVLTDLEQERRMHGGTVAIASFTTDEARTKFLVDHALAGELDPAVISPPTISQYFTGPAGQRKPLDIEGFDPEQKSMHDLGDESSKGPIEAAQFAHAVMSYAWRQRVGAPRIATVENFIVRNLPLSRDGRAVRKAIDDGLVVK